MGRYNAAEIEAALNTITILVDTREKVWWHIQSGLESLGCPYEIKTLKFGDYSYKFMSPNGELCSCENDIVIERKANAEEISGNLTKNRERFAKEFEKSANAGAKTYLIVENCNWGIIDNHGYRTKFNPKSFEASLWSWINKYDIRLQFCNSAFTAKLIYGLFRYHLKNKLEKEGEENAKT